MVLSQYTTYLAESLCGGSSRKLIAGWWYDNDVRLSPKFCGRKEHSSLTIFPLKWYSQVFNSRYDAFTGHFWCLSPWITEAVRRFRRGMVGSHVMCFERGRHHDYEKIPFVTGSRLFHGVCCCHESNVFHVVLGVSWESMVVLDLKEHDNK